jgi:hypothetical protein
MLHVEVRSSEQDGIALVMRARPDYATFCVEHLVTFMPDHGVAVIIRRAP